MRINVKKAKKAKVVISKNGPYLVLGNVPLEKEIIISDDGGNSIGWKKREKFSQKENCELCRCGRSKSPPYCDGMHRKIGFDGTETASRNKYVDLAKKIEGPGLLLTDQEDLCASARFCHNKKGNIWDLTKNSDSALAKNEATSQACDCPSGRLIAWNKKTKKPIEPKLKQVISLIEDPKSKTSGPIYLKGGIEVEGADGRKYETRNRVTLCRCGRSKNKPFCDGNHIECGFNDGDKSLK